MMAETLRFPRRRAAACAIVAWCFTLPACDRVVDQGRQLDLKDGRGITAFFVLGLLQEYNGRHVVEGDDLVEGFSCNEVEKAAVFRRQLERLALEQGLKVEIQQETMQGCVMKVRSAPLAEALNSFYRKREEPPIERSWETDAAGRHRRLVTLWIDDQAFVGAKRDQKFAYVAGAYVRYGAGDSMRFANAQHKVALLAALLKELGASHIRTESTQGLIPQSTTHSFEPSAELRTWLGREW
jgi:hypothetical protein